MIIITCQIQDLILVDKWRYDYFHIVLALKYLFLFVICDMNYKY